MSENVDINEIREQIAEYVDWALDRRVPLPELQATFRGVKRNLSARNDPCRQIRTHKLGRF